MDIEKKILVIDDNEQVRKVFSKIAEKIGYGILTGKNGIEGVELFMNNRYIKSVFSDNDMPMMNGLEATAEIRKIANENNKYPIITLISGDEVEKPSYVDYFIRKPFDINQVKEIIYEAYKE